MNREYWVILKANCEIETSPRKPECGDQLYLFLIEIELVPLRKTSLKFYIADKPIFFDYNKPL